ncbi:MAG: sigma-70 family RNA polymerase sigma factor [Oscillospiraceae bacterium]|jgi:RNA polymerase sigma factor (sigma-70 family)|nr:sigma-70 family RNA polymerase sigma factor [Oscillospiraceae bacterium]
MDRDYAVYISGEFVPVTEEVYRAYYSEKRREKTLTEKDARHGLMSFENLDAVASDDPGVEDHIIANETRERLAAALTRLNETERELIHALFFMNLPLAELARDLGIPRKTLEYRRDKVLAKLRKFLSLF